MRERGMFAGQLEEVLELKKKKWFTERNIDKIVQEYCEEPVSCDKILVLMEDIELSKKHLIQVGDAIAKITDLDEEDGCGVSKRDMVLWIWDKIIESNKLSGKELGKIAKNLIAIS